MAYDEVVLYVIDLLVLEWPVSSLCLCCFSLLNSLKMRLFFSSTLIVRD